MKKRKNLMMGAALAGLLLGTQAYAEGSSHANGQGQSDQQAKNKCGKMMSHNKCGKEMSENQCGKNECGKKMKTAEEKEMKENACGANQCGANKCG